MNRSTKKNNENPILPTKNQNFDSNYNRFTKINRSTKNQIFYSKFFANFDFLLVLLKTPVFYRSTYLCPLVGQRGDVASYTGEEAGLERRRGGTRLQGEGEGEGVEENAIVGWRTRGVGGEVVDGGTWEWRGGGGWWDEVAVVGGEN